MDSQEASAPQHPTQDRWSKEIEKWDQIYAPQNTWEETEDIRQLSEEFLGVISNFLPEGSRILEAGCGSGWQSLALARSGKFHVSLMDFSREALRYAREIFEQSQVQADFHCENIAAPGNPDYDLVFNAGVFEHYTFEEQVTLLKGMASRSRKYVMVIIPNRLCYWYWIIRTHLSGHAQWPYGKEVPMADLSSIFHAAGLHFIGNAFMAAGWTDSFINNLPNLDQNLKQLVLDIHHSPVIDPYQKSYLVAGLGYIGSDTPHDISGWQTLPMQESFDTSVLQAVIADALSSKIQSEYLLTQNLEQARLAQQTQEQELLQARLTLQNLQNEVSHLESLRMEYQDREGRLQNESLAWRNRAEVHLAELTEIKSSRMWKVVRRVWSIHQNLRPVENSLSRFVKPIAGSLKKIRPPHKTPSRKKGKSAWLTTGWKAGFLANYYQKKQDFTDWLNDVNNLDPEVVKKIDNLLHIKPYKGIIVYPHSVHWEPLQRPQQMLIEFGRKGYLCFFCESYAPEFELCEVSDNVYTVPGEKHLLFPLQNVQMIILCTWMYHMPMVEAYPNHLLWYDLIDKIDIFSGYDQSMEEMHRAVVKSADLVSYSARKLKDYIPDREDAVYLPNAARIEDFTISKNTPVPEKLAKITASGKPVIGYYGALAEWVDLQLVRELADQHPEWNFVIIGKSWTDISLIQNKANIHYVGPVPYAELPCYAQIFNVAIIPFIVNELTDCVSPIKLFEFCAQGFPIVTTPFQEVTQYNELFIKFAQGAGEFSQAIQECLSDEVQYAAKKNGLMFAENHQWVTRVNEVEKFLESCLQGVRCLANYLPYCYVAAMVGTFFHFDGRGFYAGGAERYILDLYATLEKMNVKLAAYQYGSFPWMRKYGSLDIISVANQKNYMAGLDAESVQLANRTFYLTNIARSMANIYSAFVENWPLALHPCIGISHGVAWDSNINDFKDGLAFWKSNQRAIDSFRQCDILVSVDTNTANWFQTIDYENSRKIRYLPNYVDPIEFHPRPDFASPRQKITILYPRRLYRARGLYLLLSVIDEILETCPQVEIHFVGRGFEPDTKHVVEKQKTWGERIQWYSRLPEEMPEAYRNADITLIPTLYSEGTSLSCLEAMASGNAVIATRIGGLPDLIINNHNGLLIEPQEQALKEAVLRLVNNPDQLSQLKTKAVEVARAFGKHNWELKWKEILSQLLPTEASPTKDSRPTRLVEIFLNSLEPQNHILPVLSILLQNGFLIYVHIPKDQEALIPESFHRLQFLAWDEEIYSKPELVIAGSSVTEIPRPADYTLTNNPDQDIHNILSGLLNRD